MTRVAEQKNVRLAGLIEGLPDLVAALGPDFRFLAFSRSYREEFEKIFGRRIEVGTSLIKALSHLPSEQSHAVELWTRALGGEEFTVDREFGDPRTGRFHYRITFSSIRDPQGRLLGATHVVCDVTEQMRARENVRASEERYRTLFEKMSEGFALGEPILDAQGEPVDFRFIEANRAFEEQSGMTREALNRPITETLPHLERSWIDTYCRVALTGEEIRFDNYNRDTGRHYEVFCFSPAPGKFAILFRDITGRKHAEERLRRNHETFYHLIQNNPFGVYIVDSDFCLAQVSAGAQKVFSNVRPLLGRDFGEIMRFLWPEPFASEVLEHFRHTLETGEPYIQPSMVELREDTAELEAYDWRIERIVLPDGRFGVVCYFYDWSERQRLEAALQESEERFRDIADNMAQLAWMADEKGWIFWYNRRWFDFTGTTLEEMEGWGWQKVHHPDHVERVVEKITGCFETGAFWEDTFPLRGRDGTYRWFLSRAVPIRDAEGKVVRWFGTNTDVTEWREAEEEVRRLNAELEHRVEQRTAELSAANQELEAFSYSVSHDLRAPLRHISSFVEMLEADAVPALDEKRARYVRIISEASRRMGSLIDDLLTFSRIGRAAMRIVPVSLEHLLSESRQELESETQGRRIEWRVGSLGEVEGDPALLRTVMTNLLSNALKYTRHRDPAVIEVGYEEDKQDTLFWVRDNGAGFDMRFVDKLFNVFQRLHRASEFEGTGIGLASIRRIVERHGGRVWAEGEVDRGATFCVALPKGGTRSGDSP